jgi:glycine cleavage system H protein
VAQPAGLLFSKDHEWVKLDGDVATIGISDYAQSALGDIVYVEMPRVGATVNQFAAIGVVESVKAVSDIFTPLGGEILEINAAIDGDPSLVNREPFGGGWFYKLKLADDAEKNSLMSGADYDKLIAEA